MTWLADTHPRSVPPPYECRVVPHGPARRSLPTLSRIVLVIPAHDEEVGIAGTMRSVEAQTVPPNRRIVMSDNSTDRTVAIARSHLGWEVWESVANRGKKGGALNQAWAILEPTLGDHDYLVTMDADTILDPEFIDCALAKYQDSHGTGLQLGGVCANFSGLPLDTALGVLQTMEYARAEKINRSRRGVAPVLAGAATMFSVAALRAVCRARGRLYEPVLTEDYELSLALRVAGYTTMAPRSCKAQTDLMPTTRMLWAQRLRWYRGAFESLRAYGFRRGVRSDICWLIFSLWAAASRWLFLATLLFLVLTIGHVAFSPWLLLLFAFASFIRVIQVKELGWRYMLLAGFMVEELYYAFFLEAVLWRSVYLAFFARGESHW
jgi:cellulose synthase/poly-beta-1,6-N-acetylglucosamine synthase-like glycosyltransferase